MKGNARAPEFMHEHGGCQAPSYNDKIQHVIVLI
jgi:hypothetical protein